MFQLSQHLDFACDDSLPGKDQAFAEWLESHGQIALKTDCKPLMYCLMQLHRAGLNPLLTLHAQARAEDNDGGILVLTPKMQVRHAEVGNDSLLPRMPSIFWGFTEILSNCSELTSMLMEQFEETGEASLKEVIQILNQWERNLMGKDGLPDARKRLPSPVRDGERVAMEEMEREAQSINKYRRESMFNSIKPIALNEVELRLPAPMEFADHIHFVQPQPDEVEDDLAVQPAPTKRKKKPKKKLDKKTLMRRIVLGALAGTLIPVGAWQLWHYQQQVNLESTGSTAFSTLAHIYNYQRLYLESRSVELVMESPRVFENFVRELFRLHRSELGPEQRRELQRVTSNLESYRRALRYRMAIFEKALGMSEEQQFARRPIQKLSVEYNGKVQVISLPDLQLSREIKPQVIAKLREEWQRSDESMRVLEQLATPAM